MREPDPEDYGNIEPCDVCGSKPTRAFYGEPGSKVFFLCKECAKKKYCPKCHKLFDTEMGLKIHNGRVH